MKNLTFENTPCHRCSATGNVGYGPYGGMCFRCDGAGATLTKRGRMAQVYFQDLASSPVSELRVGQAFNTVGVSEGGSTTFTHFVRIVAISTSIRKWRDNVAGVDHETPVVVLHAQARNGSECAYETTPESIVRVAQTAEVKGYMIAQALDYQASLTTTGKPRKTRRTT